MQERQQYNWRLILAGKYPQKTNKQKRTVLFRRIIIPKPFSTKIEARVESATISDRLGPNDRTSDGEEGAGFKEGRQRRQRLCARDHGKEQQYEFSFSILNIWRLSHEKMIYI